MLLPQSSLNNAMPDVPSNLTVAQFLLDAPFHMTRPARQSTIPCLIDDETGRRIYLEDMRSRTQSLAAAIHVNWEFHEGEIVSIMSFNHIDYPPCVWATHRLGGIVATLSPTLALEELVHHLKVARPSLLFVHSECYATAVEAAAIIHLSADRIILLESSKITGSHLPCRTLQDLVDEGTQLPPFHDKVLAHGEGKTTIAFLAPSSGTTGLQKAVAISHFNVLSIIIQSATFNRINEAYAPWSERRFRPGDRCFGFLPLYHIYGLVFNLHFMLYAGMTLVLASKFQLTRFLRSIEKYKITHLTIVPPQAVLLAKHAAVSKYDLSHVRYCIVAAAPMSATLTESLLQVLPNAHLGQGYGMTETCGTVSMFPLAQKVGVLGSGGQLLPGTEVKVVKEDGSLAVNGEIGELYVRGGQVALGYYGNTEATAETFVDGWLRTGDQVMFQGDDIFILERIKELIKVRGFQVAPAELEGHLLTCNLVADAAVIGAPDEYSGELPMAFIVLQPDVEALIKKIESRAEAVRAAIREHVAKNTSKYKWLEGGVVFIDSIPRNPSGKILRRLLRARAEKAQASSLSPIRTKL